MQPSGLMKATKFYVLSSALTPVLHNIGDLLNASHVKVGESEAKLRFYHDGDYKVQLLHLTHVHIGSCSLLFLLLYNM